MRYRNLLTRTSKEKINSYNNDYFSFDDSIIIKLRERERESVLLICKKLNSVFHKISHIYKINPSLDRKNMNIINTKKTQKI